MCVGGVGGPHPLSRPPACGQMNWVCWGVGEGYLVLQIVMGHILTCTLFLLQAREISLPTSSRPAFPRALTKIALPRARVPKTPGTRESGNVNPGTRAQLWLLV